MDIAFSFILLFLLLGPGFVFRAYSQRHEVRRAENISVSRATLTAFFVACILNGFVMLMASAGGYDIRSGDVLALLVANDQNTLHCLQQQLNTAPVPFLTYFMLTWCIALISAKGWYCALHRFGWEHVSSCLQPLARGHAPWFYLLHGYDYPEAKDIEGAYVAATVDMAGVTYLYEGLLLDFQLGEDGALDRLVLIEAERRLLTADRIGTSADDDRFYDISGHYFILKYDQITTLNVSYLVGVPDQSVISQG